MRVRSRPALHAKFPEITLLRYGSIHVKLIGFDASPAAAKEICLDVTVAAVLS